MKTNYCHSRACLVPGRNYSVLTSWYKSINFSDHDHDQIEDGLPPAGQPVLAVAVEAQVNAHLGRKKKKF